MPVKKKKTPKQKRQSIDSELLGEEPIIGKDNINADQYDLTNCMNWYAYFYDAKKAQNILKKYVEEYDTSLKDYIPSINRITEDRTPTTAAWLAKIIMNGCPEHLEIRAKEYILKCMNKMQEYYNDNKSSGPEKSVYQLTLEKASEYISFLEEKIDEFVLSGYKKNMNMYSIISEMNMPIKYHTICENHFKRIHKEIKKAYSDIKKGKDTDLAEGYSSYTKEDLEKILKFYKKIIDNMKLIKDNEKKAKAQRSKKKKTSPRKKNVLKFFKYLKHSDEYRLTSEPANKIIGASKVLTFDTKTQVLSLYVAEDEKKGLDIYRTAIKGFSEKFSGFKRVGSRRNALDNCNRANKNQVEKVFHNIPRKLNKCNGRINDRTLIVKVFK